MYADLHASTVSTPVFPDTAIMVWGKRRFCTHTPQFINTHGDQDQWLQVSTWRRFKMVIARHGLFFHTIVLPITLRSDILRQCPRTCRIDRRHRPVGVSFTRLRIRASNRHYPASIISTPSSQPARGFMFISVTRSAVRKYPKIQLVVAGEINAFETASPCVTFLHASFPQGARRGRYLVLPPGQGSFQDGISLLLSIGYKITIKLALSL